MQTYMLVWFIYCISFMQRYNFQLLIKFWCLKNGSPRLSTTEMFFIYFYFFYQECKKEEEGNGLKGQIVVGLGPF